MMKVGILALVALSLGGCAAMHEQQVAQMRRDGDPRANCYAACEPADVMCMNACDRGAGIGPGPTRETKVLGNDILKSAMSGNVTEADVERLKREQVDAMKAETKQGLTPSLAPASASCGRDDDTSGCACSSDADCACGEAKARCEDGRCAACDG